MDKKRDILLSLSSEIHLENDCLKMASTLNYTVKNYLFLVERFKHDFTKVYKQLIESIKNKR